MSIFIEIVTSQFLAVPVPVGPDRSLCDRQRDTIINIIPILGVYQFFDLIQTSLSVGRSPVALLGDRLQMLSVVRI